MNNIYFLYISIAIIVGGFVGLYSFLKDSLHSTDLDDSVTTTNSLKSDDSNFFINCKTTCFEVQYWNRGASPYIRLVYKSNKKVFMHSEPYTNKKFALKKARQLAEELNTEVVHINERNKSKN